jgi:ABC-type amino acid transport substrate-binding protein
MERIAMLNLRQPGALLVASLALSSSAQPLEGTLKAIKDRKAIVVGYQKDAYPLSFEGRNGADGYSVELCRRIASEAGKAVGIEKLEIRFVPVTVANRIDAVTSGKVDIECSTTTATLSRMEKVDFTNSIFVDGGGLAVKTGSAIRNVASLVGESVAVASGTTTEKALREALKDSYIDAKVVEVPDHASGIAAVQAGKVSAYASDRIILAGLLSRPPGAGLELVAMQFSIEPYAFMIRRGDSDFRLVANRALSRTYRSRDIGNLFDRWFGSMGKPGDTLVMMYLLNSTPE